MPEYKIVVPATSANVGPGFDVLGIALSLFLELDVTVDSSSSVHLDPNSSPKYNLTLEYSSENSSVSLDPDENLICLVSLHVLKKFNYFEFPKYTHVKVTNNIPLGRGLGSSAAAIVAGVLLANAVFQLNLSLSQMFDFCLEFENHPDNTTPAIVGGVSASYVLDHSATKDKVDYVKIPVNKSLKAIVAIPEFELPTSHSRSVLPKSYTISDIVHNLQRIATLTIALGQDPIVPERIYNSMKDKLHQPYRSALVPGLSKFLSSLTCSNTPGLVGVCLSGAGPTTLALAYDNFEAIGSKIIEIFDSESKGSFKTKYYILDIVDCGAYCNCTSS
ncbi:hypothetical protein BB560_003082 [Smittium megazygosporum]|uniref:Homoserine kinase n=1 Tax=Smittium megazygosporum TaxID=133381 RepID=A0A2T9ZD35_9FUNG|nr:hypothetical protein BB560_003082 [Smittium megazygosporum]